MLSREEKRQRNAAKNERRIAEEQRAAEEARQKEMEARARQKDIRRREKLEDAEARQEAAEQRLEHKARRRALREAEQKERDEDKRARTAYREAHPGFYNPNLRLHSIIVVALVLLSVYTVLSFLLKEQAGSIGGAIADALLGCFSYTAYLIPIFMLGLCSSSLSMQIKARACSGSWWPRQTSRRAKTRLTPRAEAIVSTAEAEKPSASSCRSQRFSLAVSFFFNIISLRERAKPTRLPYYLSKQQSQPPAGAVKERQR